MNAKKLTTSLLYTLDVEGVVIMDNGLIETTSRDHGKLLRRRSLKIKDETAAINITIWNDKVNQIFFQSNKLRSYN